MKSLKNHPCTLITYSILLTLKANMLVLIKVITSRIIVLGGSEVMIALSTKSNMSTTIMLRKC